jgi:hypothetical protein
MSRNPLADEVRRTMAADMVRKIDAIDDPNSKSCGRTWTSWPRAGVSGDAT